GERLSSSSSVRSETPATSTRARKKGVPLPRWRNSAAWISDGPTAPDKRRRRPNSTDTTTTLIGPFARGYRVGLPSRKLKHDFRRSNEAELVARDAFDG